MRTTKVLDKGSVELYKVHGTETDIINAARISFGKRIQYMSGKDKKLLKYLVDHNHTSPMRHVFVSFVIKAPLMIARQWVKYRVGSAHTGDTAELLGHCAPGDEDQFDLMQARNEISRRYVSTEMEFYQPSEWRMAPKSSKQGSGASHRNDALAEILKRHQDECEKLFEDCLKMGYAPEQARLFLPAYGMYTQWMWTVSVSGLLHFLEQRLGHDAQSEIRDYAAACKELVQPHFPTVFEVTNGC